MGVSLLKMTADKATVAESVTTYDRAEVEKTYAVMKEQMDKDLQRLPELEKEIADIRQRIDANGYTLDLFGALLEAFNKNYPKDGAPVKKEESETVQKPVIKMSADKVTEEVKEADIEEPLEESVTNLADAPEGVPVLDEQKEE